MPGPRLILEQRPDLKLEQRLVLKVEPRLQLSLLTSLYLTTSDDNQTLQELEHIEKLLSAGNPLLALNESSDFDDINAVISFCITCGCLPRTLLRMAKEASRVGLTPFGFLSDVSTILDWLKSPEERLATLVFWRLTEEIDGSSEINPDVFDSLTAISDVLSYFDSSHTFFSFCDLLKNRKSKSAILRQSVLFGKLMPQPKLKAEDLPIIFDLIDDSVVLLPTIEYWTRQGIAHVKTFLREGDLQYLHQRAPNCPLLISISFAGILSEKTFERFLDFAEDPYMARSTDAKRAVLLCLMLLTTGFRPPPNAKALIEHVIEISATAKEMVSIFKVLPVAPSQVMFDYPFSIQSGQQLLEFLKHGSIRGILKEMEIDDSDQAAIIDAIGRLTRRDLMSTLLQLYAVYKQQKYSRGMELTRLILVRLARKSYQGFRYEHEPAQEQLSLLENSDCWAENLYRVKHLGKVDQMEAARQAVLELVPELNRAINGCIPPDRRTTQSIQILFSALDEVLREAKNEEKKKAIAEKQRLNALYGIVAATNALNHLTLDDFLNLPQLLGRAMSECSALPAVAEVLHEIWQIRTNCEAVQTVERIILQETDDLYDLINIGVAPIQSCQRWTEATAYNKALLSYVLDANKKAVLMKMNDGKLFGRLIMRLLPFKISDDTFVPMIVAERPYCTQWSNDLGICILQFLVEKAEILASRNQGMAAIAVSPKDGKNGLHSVLQEEVNKRKRRLFKIADPIELPRSINGFEYSDSVGVGLIPSGATVEASLSVLLLRPRTKSTTFRQPAS